MSDTSARLDLPFLQPSQAQKHVTHNEALARLDLLVQLAVQGFAVNTPPSEPVEGQIWATGTTPSEAWAGQPDVLAAWMNGAWVFVLPEPGWVASDAPSGAVRVRKTTGWEPLTLEDMDNLDGIGIATSHDAFNRLAVASSGTLLTHAGMGHQVKVNKATATDTASLLFQTGFSGRVEMGTAGNDDFAIKLSPDGSTFHIGAQFDKSTGAVDFPNGAQIAGATVFHRGNVLGPVAQADGVPTGGVIEQGSNVNGRYLRFADGTQICWVTGVDMGPITAAGAGTWADPWRTNAVSLTWPVEFVDDPASSATVSPGGAAGPLDSRAVVLNLFERPGPTGWNFIRAARMGSSDHAINVLLSVMAVGRWL